jgi:hypothetical protein
MLLIVVAYFLLKGQLSPFLQETKAKVQLEDLIENAKLQNKGISFVL